ncbi:MAG TPA: hypothetical protein VKV21_09060 [Solirubrobacteraceae bacterium]|nr:hypothetical protein [Solirubrobacteraceae bacterium]
MGASSEPDAGGSLAATASGRVRAILEAAEAGAAEIRREAERDAEAIRERARADAGRASDSIVETIRRLEDLHGQLGALIASLRGEPLPASAARGESAPASAAAAELTPAPASPAAASGEPPPAAASGEPPPAAASGEPSADVDGARLVALDMALAGAPREETERHLAAHFGLAAPGALLDEVYARVER